METIKLKAEVREGTGKGSARRLRGSDKIPAVFYGRGVETRSLSVSPKELKTAVSGEAGVNSLLEIEIDGKPQRALLSEYQVHPVTRALLHADFCKVEDDRPVNVDVPLEFVGKAKGLLLGGKVRQVFRKLPIRCLPSQIPAKLTHDVTELEIDDLVSVADLKTPEGVEVRARPAQTVGGVYGARGGKKDDEAEDAEDGEKGEADKAAAK